MQILCRFIQAMEEWSRNEWKEKKNHWLKLSHFVWADFICRSFFHILFFFHKKLHISQCILKTNKIVKKKLSLTFVFIPTPNFVFLVTARPVPFTWIKCCIKKCTAFFRYIILLPIFFSLFKVLFALIMWYWWNIIQFWPEPKWDNVNQWNTIRSPEAVHRQLDFLFGCRVCFFNMPYWTQFIRDAHEHKPLFLTLFFFFFGFTKLVQVFERQPCGFGSWAPLNTDTIWVQWITMPFYLFMPTKHCTIFASLCSLHHFLFSLSLAHFILWSSQKMSFNPINIHS